MAENKNTIQIKHGDGAPGIGVLAPYELGYDSSNKVLYIGQDGVAGIAINSNKLDAMSNSYRGNNDNDETNFNTWLDAKLNTMIDGEIIPIRVQCYPAVSGSTFYGTLTRHGINWAICELWTYYSGRAVKCKNDGTWENTHYYMNGGILRVEVGGTGATDLAGARANLQVPSQFDLNGDTYYGSTWEELITKLKTYYASRENYSVSFVRVNVNGSRLQAEVYKCGDDYGYILFKQYGNPGINEYQITIYNSTWTAQQLVSSNGVQQLAYGGTGATNADDARINLGIIQHKDCNNTDFNTIKTEGTYYGYTGMTNAKYNGISVLEVIQYSPDWLVQRQTQLNGTRAVWQRYYHSGNTWSAWEKVTNLSASDVGALPISGGTTTGNIRTSASGESSVGVNFNGGSLYLWGNNSSGTRGLWDSKKNNYVIQVNTSTNNYTFNGNATSASTANDNGSWVLLSQRSIGANSSATFTDSHNCSAYIVWVYQSSGFWNSNVHLACNMGVTMGYYSNSSYWEHSLSKSGTTLTLVNKNTAAETYVVYGIR